MIPASLPFQLVKAVIVVLVGLVLFGIVPGSALIRVSLLLAGFRVWQLAMETFRHRMTPLDRETVTRQWLHAYEQLDAEGLAAQAAQLGLDPEASPSELAAAQVSALRRCWSASSPGACCGTRIWIRSDPIARNSPPTACWRFPKKSLRAITPIGCWATHANWMPAARKSARYDEPGASCEHRLAKQSLCALLKSFRIPMSPQRECVTSYTRSLAEFDTKGNRPCAAVRTQFDQAVAEINARWRQHRAR